jgi:hypothetical protein
VKRDAPVDELVSLVDIFPTLCDLAGTTPPAGYEHDGHSFAPLLKGEPFVERAWIHSYCRSSALMLRDKRWLLDGKGTLYDCGDRRDEKEYRRIPNAEGDAEAKAARRRFGRLLALLKESKANPTKWPR